MNFIVTYTVTCGNLSVFCFAFALYVRVVLVKTYFFDNDTYTLSS